MAKKAKKPKKAKGMAAWQRRNEIIAKLVDIEKGAADKAILRDCLYRLGTSTDAFIRFVNGAPFAPIRNAKQLPTPPPDLY